MTRRQKAALIGWGSGLAGAGLVDYSLSRGEANGDTLSECIRAVFTPEVFLAVYAGVSAWFVPHIVRGY